MIRNCVDKIKEARPNRNAPQLAKLFYINKLKNSTHHAPANATHDQKMILPFISIHPQIVIPDVSQDDNKGTRLNQPNNQGMSYMWHKQNLPTGEADTFHN